eukprot:364039-Chlamydomonas_euryale.AAC.8
MGWQAGTPKSPPDRRFPRGGPCSSALHFAWKHAARGAPCVQENAQQRGAFGVEARSVWGSVRARERAAA